MDDTTRQLRWFVGLLLVFLAVAPVAGLALVASDPGAADKEWISVFVAAPINLVGVVFAVGGMLAAEPRSSGLRLSIAAVLIVLGDVLLYGIRALVV
ncbi:hypothetical protein [Actinoplanes sp. GCM10030250]|uniref:hypothetical protein n=1 Tax=Actinoplanes sp. GCM10030250 TaxID=3273376 RepID=UPI0036079D58